ncbi:hypothetical protein FACS189427_05220 [Planctomycetales bacterium]|nr:hypothetical protein FACS189427_05220 [Planctomycetales bacterium]
MYAYRQTIPSVLLQPILDLPSELLGQDVEVIVLPSVKQPQEKPVAGKPFVSIKGALKEYANPEIRKHERDAWANAAIEKEERIQAEWKRDHP